MIKKVWNNDDYSTMGWHDCRIYSIEFPFENDDHILTFDIDYIFKISKKKDGMKFMISPCHLSFEGVYNLVIDLDFGRRAEVEIDYLRRRECERLKESNVRYWTFIIGTHVGKISFDAFNYRQVVQKDPVWTDTIDLEHERIKS